MSFKQSVSKQLHYHGLLKVVGGEFISHINIPEKPKGDYYQIYLSRLKELDQNRQRKKDGKVSKDFYNLYWAGECRGEYDYQRYDRRCPYCGCPDLLYETINLKTDAGGILTTLIVIVVLAVGGIALLMAMPFLILLIPILIVKKGVGSLRGDSDGALRITCKACGRRIRKFKKL